MKTSANITGDGVEPAGLTQHLAVDAADHATYAGTATSALKIQSKTVETTNRTDETVVTYDANEDKYLHRSLSDLGGGDMLKSTYDTGDDVSVDSAEQADDASRSVWAGTSTNTLQIDGKTVDASAPDSDDVLTYDGTNWVASSLGYSPACSVLERWPAYSVLCCRRGLSWVWFGSR